MEQVINDKWTVKRNEEGLVFYKNGEGLAVLDEEYSHKQLKEIVSMFDCVIDYGAEMLQEMVQEMVGDSVKKFKATQGA